MSNKTSNNRHMQTILGFAILCLPLILGGFIWPEIKLALLANKIENNTSTQIENQEYHLYYLVGEKHAKVPLKVQKEFESKYPNAKLCVTVDGKNYKVPLDRMDEFMGRVGASNVTLSVIDENHKHIPELSIQKVPGY